MRTYTEYADGAAAEDQVEANRPDFQQVYAEFQPRILRYLGRLVGEAEAEDLSQEVFARVARSLGGFRSESKLSTWLYRIATNAAFDRLRSSPQNPGIATGDEVESLPAVNAWTGENLPAVESQVYRSEMNDCIRGFVARLPENYRTVLVLSEFEGFKDEEIAAILGVALHTVKARLHRGRERLKKQLASGCGQEWLEGNEFLPPLKRAP